MKLLDFVDRLGRKRVIFALIAIAVLVGGYGVFSRRGAAVDAPSQAARSIEVKSVAELSSEAAPLSVVGTVTSRSEATVRAESSGQVTAVYRALGDSVAAGTVIAELEDDSQRAALLSAKGSVDAAQANLSKVRGGTRPEQLSILASAADGAKTGAVNALLSAYNAEDNAVRGGVDTMFSNPDSAVPAFNVVAPDSQLTVNIQNTRAKIGLALTRQSAMSQSLSVSDDLVAEIARTEAELRSLRDFLDNIIQALNQALPSASMTAADITASKASTIATRSAINSSLSAVSSARQTLQTALKNMEQGASGPQNQDVSAAEAALTQAQGAYAAAQASLEKSIIRAPISGSINSFSLTRGDYVQQGTDVVTIANNGALEVLAYITEQDRNDIRVGDKATFDNGASGVVTRVAPALDPLTKKIEVRIGISSGTDVLVNGQSVTALFSRHITQPGAKVDAQHLSIPIAAIKVGADNSVSVFTVNPDGTLVAHTIVLGELQGDRVVVSAGLTADMLIVTDARGLRDGQKVLLK